MTLDVGVEYRTLYLWNAAFEALLKNQAVCQEFSPAYMGDLLILRGEELGERGHYVMLAELVAVKDERRGQINRFIWKFENLREVHPRPGKREFCIGRVTFEPATADTERTQ